MILEVELPKVCGARRTTNNCLCVARSRGACKEALGAEPDWSVKEGAHRRWEVRLDSGEARGSGSLPLEQADRGFRAGIRLRVVLAMEAASSFL